MNGTCVGLLHPNSAYVAESFRCRGVRSELINGMKNTSRHYEAHLRSAVNWIYCLLYVPFDVAADDSLGKKKKEKCIVFCWHVILWFPHPWLRLGTLHSHEPNWKHLSNFSFFKTLIVFPQMSSTFQLTVKTNAYCTGITGSWLRPIAAMECKLPALHRNCYIQLYSFFNGFYVILKVHFAILSAHDCLLILCTHRDALAK